MQIKYLKETARFVDNLEIFKRARVDRVSHFFEEFGFGIGPKYIKKISGSGIWELRAGKVRLILFKKENLMIYVHAFYKKSQKLAKKDINLAEKRSRQI